MTQTLDERIDELLLEVEPYNHKPGYILAKKVIQLIRDMQAKIKELEEVVFRRENTIDDMIKTIVSVSRAQMKSYDKAMQLEEESSMLKRENRSLVIENHGLINRLKD